MKITKQMTYYLARQIKKRGKESCAKGWILFYPKQIACQPLSTNFIFVDDDEYKEERLSKDYIEMIEIEPKLSKDFTLIELQTTIKRLLEEIING